MHKQLLTTFAIALCGSGIASLPLTANAQTLLTRATVRDLRNQVELFLKEPSKSRPAKKADNLTPGDSLRTYRKAMAELRFNDNSLARIGEQAIFRFIPNTRNLDLQKGTVLLLIPPGQGRTQVKTPNAVAGIRGSALFVRYIEDTGVTIVGALTDSAIEISNADGSQTYVLKAGQLGTVHKNQIGIYDFDLKAFYKTSPLIKDIDMEGLEAVGQERAAPQKVQVFASSKRESVLESPPWMLVAENRPGSVSAIATSSTSQASSFPNPDLSTSVYEWSSVLATLKQYSNPTQTPPLPTGITPLVATSLPIQPIVQTPQIQVAPPAIAPPAVAPPLSIADPTPPPAIAPPAIAPPRPIPAPVIPPRAGTPATPPTYAPAPPIPTAIQPAPPSPPAIAPPVVAPAPPAIISTPPVAVPVASPVVPAIPATPASPATPTTPAVPAIPATPAVSATVISAPQVTPNLDLPSVQPGSGATTTTTPRNVNPTPARSIP